MPDAVTAESLMLRHFERLRSDKCLRDAMHALVHVQSQDDIPNVLVVVDEHGEFEGLLTARLLFRSLLALWMPGHAVRSDPEQLDQALLQLVDDRADLAVHDALIRGLPVAAPGDRLLRLIRIATEHRLEFVPVVEDKAVLGLVPVTEVFRATAALALTPDDEGIRFER
jgi:CBS domain-containing protein